MVIFRSNFMIFISFNTQLTHSNASNLLNLIEKTVMTTLYKSLVRSLLDYCCPLWAPVEVTEIQLLEGVQRTFTCFIGGLENMNFCTGKDSLARR